MSDHRSNLTPLGPGIGETIARAFEAVWPDGERWHIEERNCAICERLFAVKVIEGAGGSKPRYCSRCWAARQRIAIVKTNGA